MFNSQTKEKLTNSTAELTEYYNGDCDYEAFSKKILKNSAIIDPIVEVFKIKEEFKKRQELKSLEKPKKIKNEKYTPPIGNRDYLFICEGFSAYSGLSKILGRNGIGYFQLKGKPLNAWTCSHQKFMANEELSGLYQVIKNENFKHVVVASDADLDGFHIRGLISTFMYKFLPDEIDKLGFLNTPVVVYSKGDKITGWTYSLYDKKELQRGEVSDYKKGLGSWNEDELEEVIKKDGLEKMIEHIEFDEDSKTAIDEWFGNDSEPRKKYIVENDFSIASA
jgi:topoisomerase-4 subunit B